MENVSMTAGQWGVAGAITSYTTGADVLIENCYATGTVTGFYAGGIAGGVQDKSKLTIRNCYSAVNVTSPNGYAGGIAGPVNAATLVVENCYASGKVVATNGGGGAVAGMNPGYAGARTIKLTNVAALNSSINDKCGAILTPNTAITLTSSNVFANDGIAAENGKTAVFLKSMITGWSAFNDKLINGMPALAWQEATETFDPLGSETNHYLISSPYDLTDMGAILTRDAFYADLAGDIDMAGIAYKPISVPATAIHFDGKQHVISNLSISNTAYAALFYSFNGSVKNLGMENANTKASDWGTAGTIIGYARNALIENCYATGSTSGFYAGGLVAGIETNGKLTVRDSYAKVNVSSSMPNHGFVGGISGPANAGSTVVIENCYASGSVKAPQAAGGIFAGPYAGATLAEGAVTVKNVAAWCSEVTANTNHAIAPGVVSENAIAWNGMKVGGAVVADGHSALYLQSTVDGWDAYNNLIGGMPALAWQNATEKVEGVETNPYRISDAAGLCDMHNKIVSDMKVWFVLEDDIDMAGVKDYVPAIGADGSNYAGEFDFDGQYHEIKNFAPDAKYSYMSLFGVVRGDVRNLGIENCNIVSNSLGAGVLGGYGSHGGIDCNIDNVWATGSVKCTAAYAGGLIGTNAGNLTITSSYFNGNVEGTYAGGLVGRARTGVTLRNCYAAGTVVGSINAGGLAGTDRTADQASIVLDDVIAWNTSVDNRYPEETVMALAENDATTTAHAVTTLNHDTDKVAVWKEMKVNGTSVSNGMSTYNLLLKATAWDAFDERLKDHMPALSWQKPDELISTGVETIDTDGTDATPEYYNLQGVRVESPESGLYIVKRGNKVAKEIVR